MTSIPDHYAALGIDPTADQEVITAAYRALAKKFHPDTGATTGTANPDRFDQVQRAYEVLRTPESRHRYDLELLAATERELEEHLASKRRVVPWTGAPGGPPPPPDLGDIRPQPATGLAAGKPRPPHAPVRRRAIGPFLVPVILLLAIMAGAAWLFLPRGPDAPPLPGEGASKVATAKPPAQGPAEPAPAPAPSPAPAPAPQSSPAAKQDAVPAAAPPPPLPPPLFGSTATEGSMDATNDLDPLPDTPVQQASTAPIPAPDAAPEPGPGKPIFGSSLDDMPAAAPAPDVAPEPAAEDPAAGSAPPPPLPKLRPATPARQASQQPAPEPPAAGGGAYRLVIFERQPGEVPTAWSAGVIFDTEGSCTRFGVKAVLRRMANLDPAMSDTKIWYECQVASVQ